jgi:hypothetical protein
MSSPAEKFKNASWGRRFAWLGGALVVLFVLIQFVPYGHDRSNPPVQSSPDWQANAEQLFTDSGCADCHSNLSNWRWYDKVAPASWLVQSDIDGGRSVFNVSEWNNQPQPELGEIREVIESGEMPPLQYKIAHPNGRLSDSEKQQLIDAMTATYEKSPPSQIGG